MGWLAPVLGTFLIPIKVKLPSENTIEHAGRHETAQSV
jgi:hypothetical protein